MARSRGTKPPAHKNRIYLTHDHELVGRVSDIGSMNDLCTHLILEHNRQPHNKTAATARQHLMLHAIEALEKDLPPT